jgi:hypothetical protein
MRPRIMARPLAERTIELRVCQARSRTMPSGNAGTGAWEFSVSLSSCWRQARQANLTEIPEGGTNSTASQVKDRFSGMTTLAAQKDHFI